MQQTPLPTPLARAAMRLLPPTALQKAIEALMRGMRQSHPRLFRNLERLPHAVLRVEPSDLPHRFTLSFGGSETTLRVENDPEAPCSATIKGKLDSLLSLLEGRSDGDMLFFSRAIEIAGDTSVVVALRNTLDREEIDLLDDATGLLGPFARPARQAVILLDKVGRRLRERLVEIHEDAAPRTTGNAECAALRAEVQTLKTRLAKIEVHRQRKEASAV